MDSNEILGVVAKHLSEIVETLDASAIQRSDSMKVLGASSLDIVEVVSCSMRELRVRVPRAKLSKAENIGDLVDMLKAAVDEKAT